MRASQCLFNPATALCKVFISNATALEKPGQLQRLLLPSRTVPIQPSFSSPPRRHFSVYHAAQLNYRRKPARTGKEAKDAPAESRTMRDYDIVFPWIQVRQEDGRLSEPQRTNLVLKQLDLDRDSLILVATPRVDPLSNGPEYPICRIGDRKAEMAAEAEKLAIKKNTPKIVTKELELNWAIAPHDLRTRMTQLKKFLSKGCQVRVTMMHPKKRAKKRASLEEAKVVLQNLELAVEEVPGAKETKPREGAVGEMLVLLLHAPTGSPTKAAPAAVTEDAPAVTEEAPAATEEAPAATEEAPAATEDAPAVTEDAPVEAETAAPGPVAEEPGLIKE
ncbi:uncharacterized protein B0H64DRAFT_392491 [Chaetomium fimeti]|uniref:Translation initiation factor 3 C-terminal domain-containing protein n=1 Tax=Chaetomium fimeti TaxID=1854472 RepID=A0AAE0HJX4_9PEZI|nr:hypothetical protein B0H64DRAFT_392491 [Chaetomium fimeti]